MPKEPCKSGPVVVGGVGGSGTRVLATILMQSGFYMGDVRSRDKDNIWFAGMFFSRPAWLTDFKSLRRNTVFRAFSVFESLMFSPFRSLFHMTMSRIQAIFFFALFWRSSVWSGWKRVLGQGTVIAFKEIPFRRLEYSRYTGWGWKEPVSHIYLEPLSVYFPGLRYIHLVRDGLDMAFSGNTGQLEEWGQLFGIPAPCGENEMARAALKYWTAANNRAVEVGNKLLGERFLLMNFEELCYAPRQEIKRLSTFLGLDPNALDLDELCGLIQMPSSIGRHKEKDLSIFRPEDIIAKEKVEKRIDRIKSQ